MVVDDDRVAIVHRYSENVNILIRIGTLTSADKHHIAWDVTDRAVRQFYANTRCTRITKNLKGFGAVENLDATYAHSMHHIFAQIIVNVVKTLPRHQWAVSEDRCLAASGLEERTVFDRNL